jgi:hypothetical protein
VARLGCGVSGEALGRRAFANFANPRVLVLFVPRLRMQCLSSRTQFGPATGISHRDLYAYAWTGAYADARPRRRL